MTDEEAFQNIANHRKRKERVVFTNGCFDLLHIGHVRYLTQAKLCGEVLVVGLNSDASVSRLKGTGRPLTPQDERKEILLSLRMVDYVFIFDEETPLELIKKVRPDVLVKGGDWPVEKIVGGDLVKSLGGKVLSLPYVEGHSTSALIETMQTKNISPKHTK